MGDRELTDAALVAEMVRWMGLGQAARLIGFLMLAALNGVKTRDELLAVPFAARTTRWRVARDVRLLREHLAAMGFDMTPDELAERLVTARLQPA